MLPKTLEQHSSAAIQRRRCILFLKLFIVIFRIDIQQPRQRLRRTLHPESWECLFETAAAVAICLQLCGFYYRLGGVVYLVFEAEG